MKKNTFVFEYGMNILTTGHTITEGREYTYKEGSRIGKIIVEEVIPDPDFLRIRINFYEGGRIVEVSHRKDFTGGYMGMWRIYDESFYEENREDYYTVENYQTPTLPAPTFTKARYIQSLNIDQKDLLLGHFNSIYECSELGEHEYNIAYFAWVLGKGYVNISEEFTMNEMDVEFNHNDYEISFEDEACKGGVNLELTRSYYDLDKMYTFLVLSQQ